MTVLAAMLPLLALPALEENGDGDFRRFAEGWESREVFVRPVVALGTTPNASRSEFHCVGDPRQQLQPRLGIEIEAVPGTDAIRRPSEKILQGAFERHGFGETAVPNVGTALPGHHLRSVAIGQESQLLGVFAGNRVVTLFSVHPALDVLLVDGRRAGEPLEVEVVFALLEQFSIDVPGECHLLLVRQPRLGRVSVTIAEGPLDPPDTVATVLAAVAANKRSAGGEDSDAGRQRLSVQVACTGRRNRFDLAARITAALAVDGRVLVIFPANYVVVAQKMLEGVRAGRGYRPLAGSARPVTLASFDHVAAQCLSEYDGVVVLAGPALTNTRSKAARDAAEARLATQPFVGVMVELLVPSSRPLWPQPDLVVDATGRAEQWRSRIARVALAVREAISNSRATVNANPHPTTTVAQPLSVLWRGQDYVLARDRLPIQAALVFRQISPNLC